MASVLSHLQSHLPQILSHSPLAGYFALIFYLLFLIIPVVVKSNSAKYANRSDVNLGSASGSSRSASLGFLGLALLALGATWTYMLIYFERSYIEAALRSNRRLTTYTTHEWLTSTSLFHEAWHRVCSNAWRWWISEQLCSWTVGPLTVFLYVESKRRDIRRPWAYLLLGQVVAISFAQSIYLSILSVSPSNSQAARVVTQSASSPRAVTSSKLPRGAVDRPSLFLLTCVLTSLATVALTPTFLPTVYFLPNLLVMHALIMLPLIPAVDAVFSAQRSTESLVTRRTTGLISFQQLYYLLAIFITFIRIPTYALLLPTLSIKLLSPLGISLSSVQSFFVGHYATLFEHPAQSSIGLDVVFTTLSFVLWIVLVDYPSLGRSQSVPRAEAGSVRPPSKLVPAITPAHPTSSRQDGTNEQTVEKRVGPGWIKGGIVLLMLGIVTPLGGIGVSGSLYLGWREGWVNSGSNEKQKDT